jgi:hypothetical protein
LFRQAAYPLWTSQDLSGIAEWVRWTFTAVTTTGVTTEASYVVTGGIDMYGTGSNSGLNGEYPNIVGASASPVGVPVVGVDSKAAGSTPYFYVPPKVGTLGANTAFFMVYTDTVLSATQTVTAVVQYAQWTAPGEEAQLSALSCPIGATKSNGVSISIPSAGWFRPLSVQFEVTSGGQTFTVPNSVHVFGISLPGSTYTVTTTALSVPPVITVSPSATMSLYPAFKPAEFSNSTLPWLACRTTACASLFTNVTQVLNKGGTVLAGRISPNVYNPFTVTSATISTLHPAEKQFLGMETGLYTFVPPSTDWQIFMITLVQ